MEIINPAEKDPNTGRLYIIMKMDSFETTELEKLVKGDQGDPDNAPHVERVKHIKEMVHQAWRQTNPS